MRIGHGPGYRIYYLSREGQTVIPRQDIKRAQMLAENL
jgi:putative component of toxin-antitoxin plasmid stabilization module